MKTPSVIRIVLLSGLTVFGSAASAADQLAGALIGAGAGAVIGNAIDHRDGAVVGGIFGAILGAAISDDNRRTVTVRHVHQPLPVHRDHARVYYAPPPAVYYAPPRVVYHAPPQVRYVAPPVYVKVRPAPPHWRHDRDDRRDSHWSRGHDGGKDKHGRYERRAKDGRYDDRGARSRW
jgi:hypothetical protein